MAKQKILKFWNSVPSNQTKHRGCTYYIAAYTKKEAIELYAKAGGFTLPYPNYVRTEFNNKANEGGWGNRVPVKEHEATIPTCIVVDNRNSDILFII